MCSGVMNELIKIKILLYDMRMVHISETVTYRLVFENLGTEGIMGRAAIVIMSRVSGDNARDEVGIRYVIM